VRLTIERDALQGALAKVQGVVERRNTIPILGNVLLRATAAGELSLAATDLDIEVTAQARAEVEAPGAITVPAGRLYDIARNLPAGGQVSMVLEPPRLVVKCGRSRFLLPSLPAGDFPSFGGREGATQARLPAADLLRLIERTAFAISTEATRYYLNGLRLHTMGEAGQARLRAVSTDGARLAYAEADCPQGWGDVAAITIPRKAVGEIARLLAGRAGDVAIWTNGSLFGVDLDGVALATKQIDGHFPDYTRVIPRDPPHALVVDVAAFAAALKRSGLMASGKERYVRLGLTAGQATLRARDGDGGEAEEALDVDYAGPDLELGFNATFLADVVAQMRGESLRLALGSAADPVTAQDPADAAALFLVMPLRG
jgi:DNA polymerase-3 subunit beta